jgi:hypothetical protein
MLALRAPSTFPSNASECGLSLVGIYFAEAHFVQLSPRRAEQNAPAKTRIVTQASPNPSPVYSLSLLQIAEKQLCRKHLETILSTLIT